MRTFVYVDGFNLYYGSLKRTPYKWLDLYGLFDRTLPADCTLECVRYFTARVSALPNDPGAPLRQDAYLRALRAHCGARIEIIEGHFQVKPKHLPLFAPPNDIVKVLNTEEKGSDVNLAVELVNDAWLEKYDCAAIVSNDADLARALRLVKARKKRIVLYTPGAPLRKPIASLTRWADKQLMIREGDLAASQLPQTIVSTNLSKPNNW